MNEAFALQTRLLAGISLDGDTWDRSTPTSQSVAHRSGEFGDSGHGSAPIVGFARLNVVAEDTNRAWVTCGPARGQGP